AFLESIKPIKCGTLLLRKNDTFLFANYTKRPYSGTNQILLSYLCTKHNYEVNRWLTFKQVHELGGRVKKRRERNNGSFYEEVSVNC
ncbi:MAG: ArdC family protein, partial [Bacteroidales bacterium]|nr:ArdC family protein [Bacteroidales bacterium]